MLKSNGEAYVIASPAISLDVKEDSYLRQMRLVVANLKRQVNTYKKSTKIRADTAYF